LLFGHQTTASSPPFPLSTTHRTMPALHIPSTRHKDHHPRFCLPDLPARLHFLSYTPHASPLFFIPPGLTTSCPTLYHRLSCSYSLVSPEAASAACRHAVRSLSGPCRGGYSV